MLTKQHHRVCHVLFTNLTGLLHHFLTKRRVYGMYTMYTVNIVALCLSCVVMLMT